MNKIILSIEDLIELLEQSAIVLNGGNLQIRRSDKGWVVNINNTSINSGWHPTLKDALVFTLKRVKPKGTLNTRCVLRHGKHRFCARGDQRVV